MKEQEEKPGGAESKGKDKGGTGKGEGKGGGKEAPETKEPEAGTAEHKSTPELKTLPP